MTLTITVTVGRNIAGAPMSANHWEALQRRVRTVLAYATTGAGRLESHYGVGEWGGVVEDSAKIARYGTTWGQERDAEWLRAEIGDLARVYRQEAIALVIGEGELVGPDPLPPVRHAEPEFDLHAYAAAAHATAPGWGDDKRNILARYLRPGDVIELSPGSRWAVTYNRETVGPAATVLLEVHRQGDPGSRTSVTLPPTDLVPTYYAGV